MLYLLTTVGLAFTSSTVCHKDFKQPWECDYGSQNFCHYNRKDGKCQAKCHMFNGLQNLQSACDKQDGCQYIGKENKCLPECKIFNDDPDACNFQVHCKYQSGQCKRDKKKKKNTPGSSARVPECKKFSGNWMKCSSAPKYCHYDWTDNICKPHCHALTVHGQAPCRAQANMCLWDYDTSRCLPSCATFSNSPMACKRQPQCNWSGSDRHGWCYRTAVTSVAQKNTSSTVCHKNYANDFWACSHDPLCTYHWSDNSCRPKCNLLHGRQSQCDKQQGYCFFKGKEQMCLEKCNTIQFKSQCNREFHCSWQKGACARDKGKTNQRFRKNRTDQKVTVCHKQYAADFWGCVGDGQCEWKNGKCRAQCEMFQGFQSACDKQDACFYKGKENMCLWNCDTYSWWGCSFTGHCKWQGNQCVRNK